ncbi:MAG TPA: ABC transporter permease [Candidatus Acidoferrales bacterium]|nr:ABC transporter permease [Candidatus Acidoferrales bacterium]
MRSFWAIYRNEMSHYFVSPIAYVFGGVFLGVAGFFFNGILTVMVQRAMQMGMEAAQYGGPMNFDVPSLVVQNFFGVLGSLTLFLVPMLTMGVYAEEKKRGTIELLMTSPLRDWEIVLGKFLATLSVYGLLLVPTLCYQVFLFHYSEPSPSVKILVAGYAGVLLLAGALISLGSFLSSLTENQIVAAVLTFGVFLIFWVLDLAAQGATSGLGGLLHQISLVQRFNDFTTGVIDMASVVFFLSFAAFMVFLTLRSLDSMRWRKA